MKEKSVLKITKIAYSISIVFLLSCLILSANADSASKPYASILYFNDAHVIYPVIDKLGERGGVARLKTVVNEIKKENPDSKLIFGGDLAGGLLFGAVYHGFPMVEAMNLIPVDYANFGQHDFDFGLKTTFQLVKNSNFPWISSNLKYNDEQFPQTKPYIITDVAGIKIGIIGLIDALDTSTPEKGLIQNDLYRSAKEAINEMKDESPDFIIAITQTESEVNEKLLKENPEIGAILTEENSETVTIVRFIGTRPIISPCGNIGSLARLNIYKNPIGITTNLTAYPIDKNIKPDPQLFELEEKYRKKLDKDLGKKIADLKCDLDAGFNSDSKSRFKETNVGDLLADSYRNYYNADIGFMNGGGIRTNIEKGTFTIKDALAIIPFDNVICEYKCTGSTIKEALEHGVSDVEHLKGCFLQVSGLKYSYNPKAESGHRIVSIEVDGKPIQMDKDYTVAMPSFIFKGGDGFTMFGKSKIIVNESNGHKDINVFIDYCKKLQNIDYKTDGRITVLKN